MTSIRMLKHCAVIVALDGNRHSEITGGLEVPCWIIFKAQPLMIFRLQTFLRNEHGRLNQFEIGNRWEGAYRSMGAKRDEYGMCYQGSVMKT